MRASGIFLLTAGILKAIAFDKLCEWLSLGIQDVTIAKVLAVAIIVAEGCVGVVAFVTPKSAAPFVLVLFSIFLATHGATLLGIIGRPCPCLGDISVSLDAKAGSTALAALCMVILVVSFTVTVEG
jgi:hypothetical protein